MSEIKRIYDSFEKRLESNEQLFNRSMEMIEEKMERFANQSDIMGKQNSENGENKRIDKVSNLLFKFLLK
jgi:hypothetical protein